MELTRVGGGTIKIRIDPAKYPMRSRSQCKSIGQFHLGQRLRHIYGSCVILEEFSIPGSRLSLDFFIPSRKIAFEFQGIQHDEYNSFFHRDRMAFVMQKDRDRTKRTWCDDNKIRLIEVREKNITVSQLREIIVDE